MRTVKLQELKDNTQKYQNTVYQSSQLSQKPKLPEIKGRMQVQSQNLKQPPMNYKERVKMRFRYQISQIVSKNNLNQLVIVLDATSAFLLSNLFSVTQLVSLKIIYIQRLQVKRKKLDKHALYFINPIKSNIDMLINDFPVPKTPEQIPQYRRIHIYFTTFIQKSLLKSLAVQKGLLKRIARDSFKQFYFSSRVLAANLIDLNIPYLGLAFSKQNQQQLIRRQIICKKMIEFIASYDSICTVRIFYKKSSNKVSEMIAETLQDTIKKYMGILLENRSPSITKNAPDIVFLLLDRSIDTVTPFIHSFTYQALLFDFFPISMTMKSDLKDKGSYSYQQIQNSIYDQYRYQHVAKALQKLPQVLQDQKGKLQCLKSAGHQTVNIQQMAQRITQIKSNIDKLEAIIKQYTGRKMQDIADLQQSIATGITTNSEETSSVKIIEQVMNFLRDPNVSRQQKLRFAILCFSCIKLSKEDYEAMINLFSIQDKNILKNMIALGVSYDGSIIKSTKTVNKNQREIAKEKMKKTGMPLNRYTSIIELVGQMFCSVLQNPAEFKKIDKQIFGQIQCSIFKEEKQVNFSQDRLAISMIGGLSWAQISAIRNISNLKDALLMTDSIMTANQFLKQISKINILGK